MKDFYKQLLDNNKKWVNDKLQLDKEYFIDLSKGQTPPLLWIGCADSRVPANEIIGAKPGEVFVHRNIANMVLHTDMNMLSVLDYAVNVLKVKHIIVCGHVAKIEPASSKEINDETERFNKFVEFNVYEQVFDLSKTSIVQSAWKNGQELSLHGWVYALTSGIVKDLGVNISNDSELDDVYQLNF